MGAWVEYHVVELHLILFFANQFEMAFVGSFAGASTASTSRTTCGLPQYVGMRNFNAASQRGLQPAMEGAAFGGMVEADKLFATVTKAANAARTTPSMKIKVAINGFGRIGRNFIRCWAGRADSGMEVG